MRLWIEGRTGIEHLVYLRDGWNPRRLCHSDKSNVRTGRMNVNTKSLTKIEINKMVCLCKVCKKKFEIAVLTGRESNAT